MNPNRYGFEEIDTDGLCKPVAGMLSSDMMAVFNKVTEISEAIAKPGHRIQVKDQNGDAVFVGVMTRQGAEDQDNGSLGLTSMLKLEAYPAARLGL